jgi:hypothetical protein
MPWGSIIIIINVISNFDSDNWGSGLKKTQLRHFSAFEQQRLVEECHKTKRIRTLISYVIQVTHLAQLLPHSPLNYEPSSSRPPSLEYEPISHALRLSSMNPRFEAPHSDEYNRISSVPSARRYKANMVNIIYPFYCSTVCISFCFGSLVNFWIALLLLSDPAWRVADRIYSRMSVELPTRSLTYGGKRSAVRTASRRTTRESSTRFTTLG